MCCSDHFNREKLLKVDEFGADPLLFDASNSLVRNMIPGLDIFDFERVRFPFSKYCLESFPDTLLLGTLDRPIRLYRPVSDELKPVSRPRNGRQGSLDSIQKRLFQKNSTRGNFIPFSSFMLHDSLFCLPLFQPTARGELNRLLSDLSPTMKQALMTDQ